ncbi:hypothetical protein TREMEDRAFT_62129 [Tremella mesenterica DSM 1558]|uniref:uncharacterized protein n=1 Tax=Tremella mesenterica (strain ATCC 24925 / CBS 8224 / DSM 1558 / NBRC 9311 / NRRL Y-6157 / RJB 2259-6 / UBC 559-6) TaxID=578456 RepID=UPI0003F49B3D|nr:uncharacterized protein TREMEDRAFT_62129 [Tremella mesenterica DSM 1558]EIW69271.1 hypothetical protein TREMEDRAFT_62129 [Tremella mesenterica DSM 1558]
MSVTRTPQSRVPTAPTSKEGVLADHLPTGFSDTKSVTMFVTLKPGPEITSSLFSITAEGDHQSVFAPWSNPRSAYQQEVSSAAPFMISDCVAHFVGPWSRTDMESYLSGPGGQMILRGVYDLEADSELVCALQRHWKAVQDDSIPGEQDSLMQEVVSGYAFSGESGVNQGVFTRLVVDPTLEELQHTFLEDASSLGLDKSLIPGVFIVDSEEMRRMKERVHEGETQLRTTR